MSPRSVGRTVLSRIWMPLVAVVAVGVGLLGMYKVHQFSEPEPVITVNGPQAPEQFNLKRITYEVFGSAGKGGKLVYVDIDGHTAGHSLWRNSKGCTALERFRRTPSLQRTALLNGCLSRPLSHSFHLGAEREKSSM